MRKTISPILMFLLSLLGGVSAWAQTTWYSPGSRLSIESIEVGTDVFIYSMCRVNGTGANFSRFIVSNYDNASTLNKTPLTLVTNNVNCIWKVGSKTPIENGGQVVGYEVTFKRKKGKESTPGYLGIGGKTNTTTPGDAHKMVVSHWKNDPIVSGTEKSGDDVYYEDVEGTAHQQSEMTTDDYIYLVSARTGKSLNTADGSFQTGKNNGYPIAFYSVNTAEAPTAELNNLSVSSAPADGVWNADTKWYTFSINGNYIENTLRYCDENNKFLANKTASSNELGALWAVVGDISNGYKLYNLAAGPGKVLGVTGSENNARFTMVEATNPGTDVTTLFDISYGTDGWFIKKHGQLFDHLNIRDGYLALWNTEGASSAAGSKMQFAEVDLSTYVTTAHETLLNRVNYWKKVPAIWADAASVYDNLISSLPTTIDNTTINSVVEKHNEIGTAFINAVANKQFTAKSGVTDTGNGRYGKYMYVSSDNKAKGHTQTFTLDEVITIKPNKDLTFKLYSEYYQKYLGTPGGNTVAVNLNSAGNFDIYTNLESDEVNKVVFCNNGVATMHLLNTLEISNHESKIDLASFWLLNTDVSRNALNQVITDATSWKNKLTTFYNSQKANAVVSPRSLTPLGEAIPVAQAAYDDASGTEATRQSATLALQSVFDNAKSSWLGDLGSIQRFRLKSNAITTSTTEGDVTTTTSYYLTMGQTTVGGEGNARLMADDAGNEDQIFTLIPKGGKYIIVSNGNQLTDLGAWNTDMSTAGTPYAFEEVDIEQGLFRIRTTKGLLGPNNGVTGSNLSEGKNAYLYSNHSGTRDNLTWKLEFVSPNIEGKGNLQAIYDKQTWTTVYGLNIINQRDVPCIMQYLDKRTEAEGVLNSSTSTQKEINAAQVNLEFSYSDMLQNFIMQAAASQSYRLKYKCANDYYMTITPGVAETNVVNVMTVTGKDLANKKQIFNLIPATGENAGKFYIKECTTNKRITFGNNHWNPGLRDSEGILFTPEYTTLEGVDGIVLRLKDSYGYLTPSSANPADGAYTYTDQSGDGTSPYGYWIIEPSVSSDLISTLQTQIAQAEAYETHLGPGVNQYSNTEDWDNDYLSAYNDAASAYANSTGAYEGKEPNNTFLQSYIDGYTNFLGSISINQPTPGKLYRFKGKASGKYMCASETGQMSMVDTNDGMSTIFMLKAGEDVEGKPGYKFLSYQTGYYNKETHSNGALVAAAQSVRFYQAEDNAIGYYTLKSNYSDGSKYTYDNGNQSTPVVDRNSAYANNNCDWQIEEVTELPISVTNGYSKLGTFVSPVALNTDASRLKFYTGTIGTDSYFHVTEFTEDVIPAGVPFLIELQTEDTYANGCVKLPVYSGSESVNNSVSTALQGGIETVATPTIEGYTIYTLQKNATTNTQEFWVYEGTTIKGFRAYLPVPVGTLIRGMIFGGTTTDIEGATTEETAAPVIYDLSGRRVQHAAKGMYIVNGKKMYVK